MTTSPDFTSPPYRVDREGGPRCRSLFARKRCELAAGHRGLHSFTLGDREGGEAFVPHGFRSGDIPRADAMNQLPRHPAVTDVFVDHPRDQLGNGGLTAYPDEATANTHRGNLPALRLVPVDRLAELERLAGSYERLRERTERVQEALKRVRSLAEDWRALGNWSGSDLMQALSSAETPGDTTGTTEAREAGSVDVGSASVSVPITCGRCKTAAVAKPHESFTLHARFCEGCIDRCHESTDFAHECAVCRG